MSPKRHEPKDVSPHPDEPDIHVRVFLHGVRLDYAACLTAALIFTREHQRRHHADAVTIDLGDTSRYPRLPCERLFLGS
ncbi:hypothetical protein OG563_44395 [Nocardia vinacea]|uniref:STAS domain-containing protein n=1 Tax=Nocardia vinacea TaxID=96468 RepID=A0ABZ1YVW1_9NOCA|nr:hypothetical protein [Nocardia vinacea]